MGLSSENFLGKTGENPLIWDEDEYHRFWDCRFKVQQSGFVSIPTTWLVRTRVFPIQIAITGGGNHQFSDITIGPYGYGIVVSQVPS